MEKTQEILKHIFDLYEDTEKSTEQVINWCEKNIERYTAWEESFRDYDLGDVLNAVDEYWRFHSNKTKPTVAKLLAMLHTNKAKVEKKKEEKEKYFSPESYYMQRDAEVGRNREYFHSHYRRACSYIHTKLLPELIGLKEWRKLNPEEWYAVALKNNLYCDFDDVLFKIKNYNVDYV